MRRIIAAGIVFSLSMTLHGAVVFEEDFGVLDNGTGLTSTNTDFDYLRTGSGGGSYVALNPSTVGLGSSMVLTGSTSTSLTGVGLSTGLAGGDVITMTFNLKASSTSGDLFIGMGEGPRFSNNLGFSTSELMWGIQSDAGNLEYRTSSWDDFGFTITPSQTYAFTIYANNSLSDVDGIGSKTMDLYIDGSLIGDAVSITGNQSADGFRFYGINGSDGYEIDNILVHSGISPIPEPAALAMMGLSVGMLTLLRRRR